MWWEFKDFVNYSQPYGLLTDFVNYNKPHKTQQLSHVRFCTLARWILQIDWFTECSGIIIERKFINGVEHYELSEYFQKSYCLLTVRQPQHLKLFIAFVSFIVGPPHSELYSFPHIWVHHTVRNIVRHIYHFFLRWLCNLLHSVTETFRGTRILSTVAADIPVDYTIIAFKGVEDAAFRNYISPGNSGS